MDAGDCTALLAVALPPTPLSGAGMRGRWAISRGDDVIKSTRGDDVMNDGERGDVGALSVNTETLGPPAAGQAVVVPLVVPLPWCRGRSVGVTAPLWLRGCPAAAAVMMELSSSSSSSSSSLSSMVTFISVWVRRLQELLEWVIRTG